MDWGCGLINQEQELHLWQQRYRVLFDCNIAGVVLTNVEGRILECNEPCARIFGFKSRNEMLVHSAWEFYFHRAEREALIHQLQTRRSCPPEEMCLRDGKGLPVWVLATRAVVSFVDGRPELLQGTLVDITTQKKAQARLRDVKRKQLAVSATHPENAKMIELSQRLAGLLNHVGKTLQPGSLASINRAEMQRCLVEFEEVKMLVSRLEILRLHGE